MHKYLLLVLFLIVLFPFNKLLGQGMSMKQLKKENQLLLAKVDSLERIIKSEPFVNYNKAEPGKCYGQFEIKTQFEYSSDTTIVFEYTGDPKNALPGLDTIQILIKESYTRWIAKDPNTICNGEYADDLINAWCYNEMPAEYLTIVKVSDTTSIKDFKVSTYVTKKVVKQAQLSYVTDIRCPTVCYTGNSLIGPLKEKLIELGYNLTKTEDNRMDENTKAALMEFQKKNGLPIGQLDYETLKALGIKRKY